jgi:hypothetical protein
MESFARLTPSPVKSGRPAAFTLDYPRFRGVDLERNAIESKGSVEATFCVSLLFWSFVFLCSAFPSIARAGHGFSSAFGNIEWLPEPGRTPDSVWYRLDAVREEGALVLARTPAAKVRLCLSFAREKLAELEAMVKVENTAAAAVAADRYQAYLDRAKQSLSEAGDEVDTLNEQMANALLEQQYILSVIYPELPASSRTIVTQVAAAAQKRYQDTATLLPAKKKGALFFKEEEVRWSMDMATRADDAPESP